MTNDPRPFPPAAADEAATPAGFLDYLRATVLLKAQGLSDADADGAPDGPWARFRRDRAWEFGVTAEDSLDDLPARRHDRAMTHSAVA